MYVCGGGLDQGQKQGDMLEGQSNNLCEKNDRTVICANEVHRFWDDDNK